MWQAGFERLQHNTQQITTVGVITNVPMLMYMGLPLVFSHLLQLRFSLVVGQG